jgi:flagellar motility protein MotE (MotC chaperone)
MDKTELSGRHPVPRRSSRGRWLLIAVVACATLLPLSLTIHAQQDTQKTAQQQEPSQAKPKTLEEDRLGIVKADIQKEIEEYRKIKLEIDELRKAAEKDRQEQQLKVAKMYEAMQPEDAARRIEKLDDESALQILTTLKPKVAGKILAQIDTAKAAALSKKMLRKPKS